MITSNHRPFRSSLRRLLFWDFPYLGLMAAILLPLLHLRPMTTWLTVDLERRFGEAIAIGAILEKAAVITILWLLLPFAGRLAARLWRRCPNAPQSV